MSSPWVRSQGCSELTCDTGFSFLFGKLRGLDQGTQRSLEKWWDAQTPYSQENYIYLLISDTPFRNIRSSNGDLKMN